MKKNISVLLFCLSALLSNAQSTAYLKVSNHGTMDKIERVSSGGYISLGNDSTNKILLVRWDDNFNPVWKYRFTDAAIVGYWYSVKEANDGSFYLMLTTTGHGSSASVLKFSSSGTLLWQKEYYFTFGALSAMVLSKASGTDNGFLFGGGQCAESNYIVKCDSSGNIQWQYQYSYPLASGVITCWSIITEGNNYVVSSGYNVNSLLTFRLDPLGSVIAQSAYTYPGMQILPTRLVKLNSTGGYALLGNYNNSNNNKTEFVAIYNSNLTMLSFNELTVTYTQFILTDIAAINNGQNVILDGSIYDNSIFYIATINLSNSGSLVWKHLARGNTTTSNLNVQFNGVTALGNSTVHCGAGYYEGTVVSVMDSAGNGLCNTLPFNLTNVSRTLTLQSPTINVITSLASVAPVTYSYDNSPVFNKTFYCGSLSTSVNEVEEE
ncbi:MAG: hypothetical protein JJE25_08290, partial [Bacteroidia bacterium]|nr:hypothetical protein [Bacteroidia bacterium]